MKALVAASQCPHCGHLLDIRDSFGELLPMVHCTTCDASYLRRDGSCRWCGSTPDPVNYRPYIWKGVGAFVFAAMAVGAWFTRDVDEPPPRAIIAAGSLAASTESLVATPPVEPEPTPIDTAATLLAVSADSQVALEPAPAVSDPLPGGETTPPSVAAPERATTPAPRVLPDSAPPPAAAPVRPSAPVAAPPTKPAVRRPAPRRSARWTSAVVVSWVTVRAAPSRNARLVGSVGPDSRVQLGEVRGDWRHIRMRGITGWVKGGRFAAPRRVAAKRRAAP